MTEDVMENQGAGAAESPKTRPGKKKLFIIVASVIILCLVSGYFAYSMLIGNKASEQSAKEKTAEAVKVELLALDPFVMNLTEQGRFLKVAIQFELGDKSYQPLVADKIPQLRDAIIILVSSKSFTAISSPDGKFQLKDEILLRANQTIGKDVFKNMYFTEFVMQ